MTVDSVDKFSLSALYSEADKILQEGVNSIINDNSIGTGGSIWGSFTKHHFCNSLDKFCFFLFETGGQDSQCQCIKPKERR